MTFNIAITHAAAAWFSEGMTEAVTYNGTSIRGHIEYLESGPDGCQAVVTVRKADVPAPAYRDQVTVGGVAWRAVQGPSGRVIRSGDAVSWEIYLNRDERAK
jgi:hypothetical protein